MRKLNRSRSRVETTIPPVVGDRFLNELSQLIDGMDQASFKVRYQKAEMLSKYSDPTTTPADERRSAAIRKWMATEQRNLQTNPRLFIGDTDLGWVNSDTLVERARELIARVLGPLEYPSVIQDGCHTNGASTRVRKSPSAALFKLMGEGHISSSAIKHWLAAFSGTRLSSQTLSLMESSVLFTVPKTSSIDRVAAKEPECNMLLQRSVGNHIRRRLKVFGIDLNDQTINRELARTAVARKLATIDLSSASDSISKVLVERLLPYDWFSLLDDLRVKSTIIDGDTHELEMFSSMGNGFTFELESLIFYALTRVVCHLSGVRGRISVYGDDIIAPVGIVPRLSRVFHFFGFTMNLKKTHYRGSFRESCGLHSWKGVDVTPFYVKRAVRTLPDMINHLNALLEWDGRGWGFFLTEEAYHFWVKWKEYIPKFLWGGIDPSDPTALVTGDNPRLRLVPRTRKAPRPAAAGLDLWLLRCDVSRSQDMTVDPFAALCEHDVAAFVRCIVVDPRFKVGYKAKPLVSRGERTTWSPDLIWSGFA